MKDGPPGLMSSHADAEHSPDAKRRSPECLGEVAKSDEDYEKKFFNNVTTPRTGALFD
jgi:hypothetical protein